MTTLLDRAKPQARKAKVVPLRAGRPQVNLLPPEVKATRRLNDLKGWLGLAVLGALVLVVAGYVSASLQVRSAQDALDKAQSNTTSLLEQKKKVAPVTPVLAELGTVESARTYAGSLDVLWAPYLGAITAVLPKDATLSTLVIDSASPVEKAPTDTIASQSLGTITFDGTVDTLPDTAAWVDALDAVPGFSGAAVKVAQRQGGPEKGDAYYEVTSSVQVTTDALSGRFVKGGK